MTFEEALDAQRKVSDAGWVGSIVNYPDHSFAVRVSADGKDASPNGPPHPELRDADDVAAWVAKVGKSNKE